MTIKNKILVAKNEALKLYKRNQDTGEFDLGIYLTLDKYLTEALKLINVFTPAANKGTEILMRKNKT